MGYFTTEEVEMGLNENGEAGKWGFETDEIVGYIQPDGDRHGIKELTHKPSGVQVVHPKYDVFNLFFMFSTNHCMGTARDNKRTIEMDDETIEIHWEPTEDHKAEITAKYEVVKPNIIDLSITVHSNWPYPGYEVFLSNYFQRSLKPHVYVQGSPFDDPADKARWIAPQVNDVFVGTGLVFSRDQHAARRSVDGRWDRIWGLYQWNPQRYFEFPVIMSVDAEKGVAAVLMSRPEDCYAVISGYDSDNDDDPFADQNPLYMSLFGDDFRVSDERTVEVRFAVTEIDEAMSQPLGLYESFLVEKDTTLF